MRHVWLPWLSLSLLSACATPAVRTTTPAPASCVEEGLASWYGRQPGGNRMADGRAFNPNGLTAAHRWLPLGTSVRVENLDSGRSVVVRITDRGPVVRRRIIDVSEAAAKALAMKRDGLAHVRLEPASPAACGTWQTARWSGT